MEIAPKGSKRGRSSVPLTVAKQRRDQIIEAAKACVREERVGRLTMRKVAERAGLSHVSVHYYFKSKRALINATLLSIADDYFEAFQRREQAVGPRALADLVHMFLDPSNPAAHLVTELLDAGLHDAELKRVHIKLMREGGSMIERSVRAGIESGHFRPDIDAPLAAAAFHRSLLWLGLELRRQTISQEYAINAGLAALQMLKTPSTSTE